MKHHLESLIAEAIGRLRAAGKVPPDTAPTIQIERTRTKEHGDFACNVALSLAKAARLKPRDLADRIVAAVPSSDRVARIEIAGPGFINFHLRADALHDTVRTVLAQGASYGRSSVGAGRPIQVEFVSANPTGPLHVGHGRGAAYGATVANLLEAVGFKVHGEYYVNDAGRQMDILGTSVWLRYLERCGERFEFPSNGYKGEYVYAIADKLHGDRGDAYRRAASEVFQNVPPDEPQGGDKEKHIDALIARTKELLGPARYEQVFDLGLKVILDDIREDLAEFGVVYDEWFSERSLAKKGLVDRAIERLKSSGHVYERDGALWFRSTDYGDEKDRVLVRENGQKTYFASDIAYHYDKFLKRRFDQVIDIWGADHQGHVSRVKTAVQALGVEEGRLEIIIGQLVSVRSGDSAGRLSKRAGNIVTLREVVDEVGKDACRFFFLSRSADSQMEFDLDLAKKQSTENPVYYVQYAHARIAGIVNQAAERGIQHAGADLRLLSDPAELALIRKMLLLPELIESIAESHEPHHLPHYAMELATTFHDFYERCRVMPRHLDEQGRERTPAEDELALSRARLRLVAAAKVALARTLDLMGMEAPERM